MNPTGSMLLLDLTDGGEVVPAVIIISALLSLYTVTSHRMLKLSSSPRCGDASSSALSMNCSKPQAGTAAENAHTP